VIVTVMIIEDNLCHNLQYSELQVQNSKAIQIFCHWPLHLYTSSTWLCPTFEEDQVTDNATNQHYSFMIVSSRQCHGKRRKITVWTVGNSNILLFL